MHETINGIRVEKMDTGRIQMSKPTRETPDGRLAFEFKRGSLLGFDWACSYLGINEQTKSLIATYLKSIN